MWMPGSGPTLMHLARRGCGTRLLYLGHSGLELYNMLTQLKLSEHQSRRDHLFQEQACFRRLA
jgi:hypothetical protein